MFASFYYIDDNYIKYLQNIEIQQRGFTCVPNVSYANKEKFTYGLVMEKKINNQKVNYFVPVTSYHKNQSDNILIKTKQNKQMINTASLRFNYMIPVPQKCLQLLDFNNKNFTNEYKILLEKEYQYIKKVIKPANILKQAQKTYDRVVNGNDEILKRNSCDFNLLEQACIEYMQYQKHYSFSDAMHDYENMDITTSSDENSHGYE